MIKRVHIIVSGRIQGIGFRASTVYLAKSLGLTGWVRNLVDGTVEIVAEGNKEAIEKFLVRIKQGFGPGSVADCKIEAEVPTGEFFGFEIMY